MFPVCSLCTLCMPWKEWNSLESLKTENFGNSILTTHCQKHAHTHRNFIVFLFNQENASEIQFFLLLLFSFSSQCHGHNIALFMYVCTLHAVDCNIVVNGPMDNQIQRRIIICYLTSVLIDLSLIEHTQILLGTSNFVCRNDEMKTNKWCCSSRNSNMYHA